MMIHVGSPVRHRMRMRIRQEAIFNPGVNGPVFVEEKFLSPVVNRDKNSRKSMGKSRSKLDDVFSRGVPNITIRSDAGSISDEKVCRNVRQDHKDDLVDAILVENITTSESEASSCEGLDDKLNTKLPETERTRDFVTTTLVNTGRFPQISSEASTLTNSSITTSGNPVSLSPSRGLIINKLNG